MSDQPLQGPTAYDSLIERLRASSAASSNGDPLAASADALIAVLKFLASDQQLRGEAAGALTPLFRLLLAVQDTLQGAKPRLFFERPNSGRMGAPTWTAASTVLRPNVVMAYYALTEATIPKETAARAIESALRQNRIKQPNGKPITARQIIRWARELRGKSPEGSDWAFDYAVHDLQANFPSAAQASSGPPDNPQCYVEVVVRLFIDQLRIAGFSNF